MNTPIINERAQRLLKLLIEHYIREGQPVPSQVLAQDKSVSLSPASVRNVLADLEKLGYLSSPHTSAGRVPTQQGYRLFVDTLLMVKPLETEAISSIKNHLELPDSLPRTIQTASHLLSGLTKLAGLVSIPKRRRLLLKHLEFLPLSGNRVLVVIVFNGQEVQNRIIYTDRLYTSSELQEASNFVNEHYSGRDFDQVRMSLLQAIRTEQSELNRLMELMTKLAESPADFDQTKDYVLEGQGHLLGSGVSDDLSLHSLRALFEAFTQKQGLLHLIDKCINAEGVQIYIGEESGHEALEACSLVTSRYSVNGEVVGSLAVIGPKRMDYEKVIPIVDITAKLLSAALSEDEEKSN
jgi:heat-inducible transcriptional repressor